MYKQEMFFWEQVFFGGGAAHRHPDICVKRRNSSWSVETEELSEAVSLHCVLVEF